MNDIRRTILWVIFGFSMVLLWDQWQVYNGRQATFFPKSAPSLVTAPVVPKGAPLSVPSELPTPSAAPSASGLTQNTVSDSPLVVTTPRENVIVSTDVLKLTFDSDGGSIVRSEFLKHSDKTDPSRAFVLLDSSKDRVYLAQTGLLAGDAGGLMPTHKTPMTVVPGERIMGDGVNNLEIRFESAEVGGVKLIKTFTMTRGSYAIAVKHEVINVGTATISPQLYFQLVRDGNKPVGESSFYSTFTGPAVYTEAKKYQKVEFKAIETKASENKKVDIESSATNGYVAMVQHYFASAWLLGDGVQRDLFMRKVDTNLYSVGMITHLDSIAPGTSKSIEARFFSGPQEEKVLESLAPGLELVKDYGWLTILAKPLYWLLDKIHNFIGNWGWSIMSLVLLLKAAFYWLNAKAYSSMAKMKAVNPKITEMRARLKDNPQQMQQEMMRIYREEKVNPMGGCFPIMIQIPVFIALYWVLLSSVEMRNAPWVMWIHDLSSPDPFYILPIVMAMTTMLQTALNPAPPDPLQAKMMWFMPLAFSVMFFFFPAGLVLYWITNNILSIAQQWLINTRMGVPPQFNLPKFK